MYLDCWRLSPWCDYPENLQANYSVASYLVCTRFRYLVHKPSWLLTSWDRTTLTLLTIIITYTWKCDISFVRLPAADHFTAPSRSSRLRLRFWFYTFTTNVTCFVVRWSTRRAQCNEQCLIRCSESGFKMRRVALYSPKRSCWNANDVIILLFLCLISIEKLR